jgi:protein-S-isoprenylcysteine O-methyltransferase Ste14
MKLILKGLLGGIAQIVGLAFLFFGMKFYFEGDWYWERGVWFLVCYGVLLSMGIIWLGLSAPASLAVRLQGFVSRDQPQSDRIVTFFLFWAILSWIVLIPVDLFWLHLFSKPSTMISSLGGLTFLLGFGIVMFTIYQNSFAAPIVKDQRAQGQVVIDTGLYRLVRHPMYLGLLLWFFGMGLFLETTAAAVFSIGIDLILLARISVEEKMLREVLPGYTEYTKKTRARLIPCVW